MRICPGTTLSLTRLQPAAILTTKASADLAQMQDVYPWTVPGSGKFKCHEDFLLFTRERKPSQLDFVDEGAGIPGGCEVHCRMPYVVVISVYAFRCGVH